MRTASQFLPQGLPVQSHGNQSTTVPSRPSAAPWLMLAGVVGMVLALCGLPMPILSCLLLVGVGADSDLARRAALFAESGVSHVTLPLRGLHAGLYASLYFVAWGAMHDLAASSSAHWLLTADLGLSLALLVLFARRSAARDQASEVR